MDESVKPKRRYFQFRLRTLLIAVLLLSLLLSWYAVKVESVRRQRKAVQTIERAGGSVRYAYQSENPNRQPPVPRWLYALLGDDFFFDVTWVLMHGRFGDDEATQLKELRNLVTLYLNSPQITNDGLEHLEELTKLTTLDLSLTQVTDSGLEHIEGLSSLTDLDLSGLQVTDHGLEHLEALKNLTYLDLSRTQISDAGLEHLRGLTKLSRINVTGTQVTPKGVKKLRKALPECYVFHDG